MSGTLRPPRDEDASVVAGLMGEHSPEPVGEERVLRGWTSPRIDRRHDVRLGDGFYAAVEVLDEERVWIEVHGRPFAELLDWSEARAGEKGTRLFSGAWASNEPVLRELERRGFRLIRHAHRMEIDLGEPTADPVWPGGIGVRTLRPGDEHVFHEIQEETFRDSWEHVPISYEEWEHWLVDSPRHVPDLWFLAVAGDEPAGFAICHPQPESPDLGWVGVLGVRRPWRRRGLGRALLLHAFAEFRRRGLRRAGLGVDAESLTGANVLYEQVGMHVSARYDIYEKRLA